MAALESRMEAVLQEQLGLSRFSMSMAKVWLSKMGIAGEGGDPPSDSDALARVRAWLLQLLNGRARPADVDSWQRRCPEVLPKLTSCPVWDIESSERLAWIRELQRNWREIRTEALALQGHGRAQGFQPYRAPSWVGDAATDGAGGAAASGAAGAAPGSGSPPQSSDSGFGGVPAAGAACAEATTAHKGGSWNVCYFALHGAVDTCETLRRCPRTAALLASVPRGYAHAMLSALAPGTSVVPHHGPTNKKLRLQLPLVVPPPVPGPDGGERSSCCLRVAGTEVPLCEGEPVLFDDSFEHEAWNRHPTQPRVVLIVDVWHPDLSDEEVKFLSFVHKANVRAAKAASATRGGAVSGSADFLTVLEDARGSPVPADLVFPRPPDLAE